MFGVDVPTDCPQRDERLGWTGDIQVFAPAAAFYAGLRGVAPEEIESVEAVVLSSDLRPTGHSRCSKECP
ncbi:alpha-L-rhamnosidase-related protein [Nonomuraea wenchangensis]